MDWNGGGGGRDVESESSLVMSDFLRPHGP